MTTLGDKIKAEVDAVEAGAEATARQISRTVNGEIKPYLSTVESDIRKQMPGLMAKLGINTADEHGVFHAVLMLVIELLEMYGPEEIRSVLAGL